MLGSRGGAVPEPDQPASATESDSAPDNTTGAVADDFVDDDIPF